MADHIKIRRAEGTWVVRSGGAVLGETNNALELTEGDYAPVYYFPREDIAMAFLDRTDKVTHCQWKGDANYFSIVSQSGTVENAAWTYENPMEAVAAIKDHLAFYASEDVTVERV
ncbi:DUF427 domain-containing protein [Chachezhania sediminis]|uniref:DUF427 domain-containing protein n=1 Tax=Chachezhania sediminis TaxID=2599291 RepID=UPI00131DB42C|nr:DUF427 domain-containing protein [Chachezhania sediminis]